MYFTRFIRYLMPIFGNIFIILLSIILFLHSTLTAANLVLKNGTIVQTFTGERPTQEDDIGIVQIDGNLYDNPDETSSGYLDGIIQSNTRSRVNEFAGLELNNFLYNAVIRRVTQVSYNDPDVPAHFVRYYKIINDGSAINATMHFSFVENGHFMETNGVPAPWVIWGAGRYWGDNAQNSSPLTSVVDIPTGISVWLGVEKIREFATLFAKIYLQGAYDIHIDHPEHSDKDKMVTKLRYSPRSYPPKGIEIGDCWIPVISPYEDRRFSGYSDPNNMPENIVDWVYLRFRPGDFLPEEKCDIQLENGYTGYSCFLRHDGALIDVDGSEGVEIPGLPEGEYYLTVAHRNHLTVMSSIPLNSESLKDYQNNYYDFTESFEQFYAYNGDRGTFFIPRENKILVAAADGPLSPIIVNGKEVWVSEKTDQIEGYDYNYWKNVIAGPEEGIVGYQDADYDMASLVEGRDETLYMNSSLNERSALTRSPFSWPAFEEPCLNQRPAWFMASFKKTRSDR